MTRYEIDHQKEFRQLRKKNAVLKGRDKREQAKPPVSGKKTFTCTWAPSSTPGEPTSHKAKDCRIKAQHLNVVCDVCGQGPPIEVLPERQGWAANQADEQQVRRIYPQQRTPRSSATWSALMMNSTRGSHESA